MSDDLSFLQTLLAQAEQNMRLIQERKAAYVQGEDVPLQLVKNERELAARIASLKQQIADLNSPASSGTIAILFLTADPSNASRLRLGEEAREIQEKLQLAQMRERFVLHQRHAVRPTDLTQAMLDVKPQIVHFSGHGLATGALCFEDKQGQIQPIEPDALAALFELVSDHVGCVLLNACYSETQASAIGKHIPYVIGMNRAIGDEAAIAFAIGFYQALGNGRPIDDAYRFGVVQIRLHGIAEHLTPVLFKRA